MTDALTPSSTAFFLFLLHIYPWSEPAPRLWPRASQLCVISSLSLRHRRLLLGCLRLQLFRQLSLGLTLWELTQPTHPSTATLLPRKGNLGGMRNLFRRPRCPAAWLTHEPCPQGCHLSLWNFGGFSDFPSQPCPWHERRVFQFTSSAKKSRQSKPKAGWAELFNRLKTKVRNSSVQQLWWVRSIQNSLKWGLTTWNLGKKLMRNLGKVKGSSLSPICNKKETLGLRASAQGSAATHWQIYQSCFHALYAFRNSMSFLLHVFPPLNCSWISNNTNK